MADGSGVEERLATKQDTTQSPTSVSPDGRWLVFNENSAQEPGGVGIWLMKLDGDRTSQHLFPAPAGESDGQFSPDGKWIAYQANVSSRQEVYVSPFPGPGPRRQVSTNGGLEPLWSRDGRELFFQNGSQLMGVTVTPGAEWSASQPHVVYEGRFLSASNGNTSSSINRDGTRFLRIQLVEPERAITHVDLVLNWFSELQQRVAGAK
jgi:Tol biopolymer transport system component